MPLALTVKSVFFSRIFFSKIWPILLLESLNLSSQRRKMGATRLMQMLSAFLFFVELFVICDNQTEEDPLEKIYSSYVKTIRSNSFYTSGYEDNGMQTDSDVLTNMVVSVDNFGAVGDGITDDTEAFQNAWNVACSSVFPIFYVSQEKLYLLNPINFSGPCQSLLTVQISGTIIAPEDPDVWEELHTNHWLLFNGINNLVVGGGGMINGRGEHRWAQSCKINITNPCKPAPTLCSFTAFSIFCIQIETTHSSGNII